MTISIVLATYNGEKYLREQIDSVLAQTLMPDEIIVSDDGSTDGTWDILEEYKNRNPSLFHLYHNVGRHGPHANFKWAFQYVTGDVVVPCDQDDIWLPEKLERCAAAMAYDVSFVFCQEMILHEDGNKGMIYHKMPLLRTCIFGEVIPGHLIMCRREVLEVFNIAPEITYDWGMTLYAAIHRTGKEIDYVGCIWRRHANVVTTEFSDHKNKILKVEQISKWKKLCRSIRMMRRGVRSEVVARRMDSLGRILEYYQRIQESHVVRNIEKQTAGALICACWQYAAIVCKEKEFKEANIRTKIGKMAHAFCYPAMWWYDYHKHDSL